MKTATLTFPTHQMAKDFARKWAFKTLRGYTLSAANKTPATLYLSEVTPENEAWINGQISALNK